MCKTASASVSLTETLSAKKIDYLIRLGSGQSIYHLISNISNRFCKQSIYACSSNKENPGQKASLEEISGSATGRWNRNHTSFSRYSSVFVSSRWFSICYHTFRIAISDLGSIRTTPSRICQSHHITPNWRICNPWDCTLHPVTGIHFLVGNAATQIKRRSTDIYNLFEICQELTAEYIARIGQDASDL